MIVSPLATRPVAPRAHAQPVLSAVEGARPEATTDALHTGDDALEDRIDATVDAALAQALAKVKTPADDAIAKQQQAFDQMMQLRTEQEREANAIREFGMAQQKKENDFLQEFIRMI